MPPGLVRDAESGRRTLPARAAVMLADVLGLTLGEVAGLAPAEIRLDAGQAHALAREVAVLLGARWAALRAPDAAGLRVLAAMRWALAGAGAVAERGVYVACVPLTSGGRVVAPGEVVPGLEHATAAGIAAEVASGRVTFVPLALIATASASPSTSTAEPR